MRFSCTGRHESFEFEPASNCHVVGTAAAIIGGAVIGAVGSSIAGSKAAGATKDAANSSIGEQQRQFDLVRQDTAKQRALGDSAINRINRLYGYGTGAPINSGTGTGAGRTVRIMGRDVVIPNTLQTGNGAPVQRADGAPDMSAFFTSPDYQFNLAEGQKAIDRSLVARGRGLSGAGVKAGVRYASGLASREYSDFYNRLASQAGIGQTGVSTSANAGANAANNISSTLVNAGNARASSYIGAANGINDSIQGGLSNYLLTKYVNAKYPGAV